MKKYFVAISLFFSTQVLAHESHFFSNNVLHELLHMAPLTVFGILGVAGLGYCLMRK